MLYCQKSSVVAVMLVQQNNPHIIQHRSNPFREYRCYCSSRASSASRVGTLPSFFQGWVPLLPQLNGASVVVPNLDRWLPFLLFDFTRTHPAFVYSIHSLFSFHFFFSLLFSHRLDILENGAKSLLLLYFEVRAVQLHRTILTSCRLSASTPTIVAGGEARPHYLQ